MSGISVQIRMDTSPLTQLADQVGRVRFAAASQQAMTETLRTGRASIARQIGDVVNLRIRDIKSTIHAKSTGGFAEPAGSIVVSREAVPLYKYLTTAQADRAYNASVRGGRGVRVRVRKNAPIEVRKESFVRVMRSGHVGVYRRVRQGDGRVARLPIKERFGPTAVGVFANARGADGTQTILEAAVADLADQLIARVMSKAKWLSETDDATTRRLLAKAARVLHEPVE